MENNKFIFLGGCQEIGANSSYFKINGTGILIDTGLHPQKRNKEAFPNYSVLENEPVDHIIITHAHFDHIGALPYAMKHFPHAKIFASEPTADLIEIMLKDTIRILNTELANEFDDEILSLYNKDVLSKIHLAVKALKFNKEYDISGINNFGKVALKLQRAGHIIGAASVMLKTEDKAIFHTGDINNEDAFFIKKAESPPHHVDILISESTNYAENLPEKSTNKKNIAKYINDITNENGSVLIPVFSLGKFQEILVLVHNLMHSGKIPHLPIYTGGLGRLISKVYDKYCYSDEVIKFGFEVSDISTEKLFQKELLNGKYLKEPGIVITTNGMLHKDTISYKLALEWFNRKNFGIAIPGYVSPETPAGKLIDFDGENGIDFGGRNVKPKCKVEQFRFSLHSRKELLFNYISDINPKQLYIIHGDIKANEKMQEEIDFSLKATKVKIPECNVWHTI
jgi:Cft2 family RNA processing exonuclease